MPRIEVEVERFDRAEDLAESSTEIFDRIAFAERAIALACPPRTRVAICQGSRRVQVTSGRQWGAKAGSRWAIMSVPPDASRRAIASAVLGLHQDEQVPYRASSAWRLDVLISLLGRATGVPQEGPLTGPSLSNQGTA
jgi:hypothetical protein